MLVWKYARHFDKWQQSIPLCKIVPHPMLVTDGNSQWRLLGTTLLLPLVAMAIVSGLDFQWHYVAAAPVIALAGCLWRFWPWLLGPIEWATYDTTLEDKTVYFFRGSEDAEFFEFIAQLNGAIEAAHDSVGTTEDQTQDPAHEPEAGD